MKERVIVYGSTGYKKWATWVDSVISPGGYLGLVCVSPDEAPFLLRTDIDHAKIVANEEHARQLIADDMEYYLASNYGVKRPAATPST